jgi:hypothetical protein
MYYKVLIPLGIIHECGKQDITSGNGIMRDYEECIVCGIEECNIGYGK